MMCTDLVDKSRTASLNGCSDFANIMDVLQANPDDKALTSDVDPQLIMKVFFKEKVNVSSILVRFNKPPSSGSEGDEETYANPRLIKVFSNMGDLDFSDFESASAHSQALVGENDEEVKITCI